jgi:hypothetical protein
MARVLLQQGAVGPAMVLQPSCVGARPTFLFALLLLLLLLLCF